MTKIAKEAAELIDSLPAEKAQEVLDFARYLADRAEEEAWEKSLSNPQAREKLQRFAEDALKEPAETLDPEKM